MEGDESQSLVSEDEDSKIIMGVEEEQPPSIPRQLFFYVVVVFLLVMFYRCSSRSVPCKNSDSSTALILDSVMHSYLPCCGLQSAADLSIIMIRLLLCDRNQNFESYK